MEKNGQPTAETKLHRPAEAALLPPNVINDAAANAVVNAKEGELNKNIYNYGKCLCGFAVLAAGTIFFY